MTWPGPASTTTVPRLSGKVAAPLSGRLSAVVQTPGTFLVAALFAPWIALAGSGQKILLAIVLLDIPLQIDKNVNYLADAAEFGAVSGFNVSLTTVALAALYAAWLIDRLVHRNRSGHVSIGLLLPLAPYALVSALSVIVAHDIGLYSRGLFLQLQMFLIYLYLVGTVRTEQDVRFVVTWLLAGLMLEGLIIISLGLAGEGFQVAGLTGRFDASTEDFGAVGRFGGTVGSPNNAAAYLAMLLAPALAVLATNLGRSFKMLAVLGLGFGSVALIMTLSRGGWLAAVSSLAIVCLWLRQGRRLSPAVPVLLVVLLSTIALLFHQSITERLAGDDRDSARSRVPLMVTAFEIIGDNPVLGVGGNNFTAVLGNYASRHQHEFLYTVHNQYLLVWAETGLVGLAAFLWFLFATIRRGWHRWKRRDEFLSPLALGFTAGLIGQMVHMNVDVFSARPQVQLLMTVAALITAVSRMESGHR